MDNTESAPEAQPEKPTQTRKTLFMVIGFLAVLVVLVALNMN